ncbi:MAG: arsenic efflux protein [Bryobacterales bacterium]|nr:arsenic efflux protein [Bryobacterales bacterium]
MIGLVTTAVTITGFVAVMMLLIEYLNVLSVGAWQRRLADRRWGQYLLAALLGAVPGCLGAFAVVTMYTHGALTRGALAAAMIATSGDEAFVMLALIPEKTPAVFGVLFLLGAFVGALVDWVAGPRATREPADCLELHPADRCLCLPSVRVIGQWRQCTAARGTLAVALGLYLVAILAGEIGDAEWTWIRVSLAAVSAAALFVVVTVPDHFLEEHLWRHVVQRHAPRILLWTLGALAAMHLVTDILHVEQAIREGRWILLLAACLTGLIPESGPHLVFVTLYANGTAPLSVLLASSIVQDGHGMLPLLAHSRREFLVVKAINLAAGLGVGALAMAGGI